MLAVMLEHNAKKSNLQSKNFNESRNVWDSVLIAAVGGDDDSSDLSRSDGGTRIQTRRKEARSQVKTCCCWMDG